MPPLLSSDSEGDSPPLTPTTPPPSYGPSGRLPIELLSEIFLLCVEERMDLKNTVQIPLLLSNICSRWRAAAIDNPLLWSRLSIELSGAISKPKTALVDTWLARSAACPLTIYVFWEKPPFADMHLVLEKLIAHSERWKTMFFYLPYRAFKSFASVRNRLPMLTDLSLGTDDDVSIPSLTMHHPSHFNMFEIAPRLRSLECVNFSPTILKFPWAQLEDIPLLSGNIEDCLDILHRGKRLSKVSVIFVEGGPVPWSPTPASPSLMGQYPYVSHDHLTCFSIMTPPWNEFVDLGGLFPYLTLPHLETLTICNLNSTFGDEFTQFLSRLPTLKTLHLRKTALPDDQLVEGLKHLSSLTSLIVLSSAAATNAHAATVNGVSEPTVTRYLLEALTRNFFSNDAMDGMLLPRLQKLELTVSSTAARELDVFIDMLQSRLRDDEGLARLEHVRVRPSVALDDEFHIRLVELRDFGLEVEVESPTEPC
ncbi:hypothetical protein GALMADRAFT_252113 [Galerina marginata CBS 339.88]|uniref:Uncharacterized protein n=1 Tax=Galerina marginata (strain CBS 339.88) TaxID=685588 RepID=A0A067SYR1_GALM3|nr:hypothetical protein GALMADRAFT_252113 [Galerina marginata CBS 339.88]